MEKNWFLWTSKVGFHVWQCGTLVLILNWILTRVSNDYSQCWYIHSLWSNVSFPAVVHGYHSFHVFYNTISCTGILVLGIMGQRALRLSQRNTAATIFVVCSSLFLSALRKRSLQMTRNQRVIKMMLSLFLCSGLLNSLAVYANTSTLLTSFGLPFSRISSCNVEPFRSIILT